MTVALSSDLLKAADTHANRPAANTVPVGALYSCTTHSLVYRSDGSSWATWATLGGGGGGGAAAPVNPELGVVAMTTFDNTEMQVRLVTSSDGGSTFTNLARAHKYADPDATIGVRDASVVRFAGKYVIAYTRANLANYLGVPTTNWGLATSDDLLTFTQLAVVTPGSPASITDLWAPDLMVDGDTLYAYMSIRTSSSGGVFQTYVSSAHASDLTTWSTPTLVTGLGTNTIDLTVRKNGTGYVGVVKNETAGVLYLCTATSPAGPFTLAASALPTSSGSVEGGSLLELPQGGWRVYFDAYSADHIKYIESTDGLATWSSPVTVTMPASNLRHPGVLWLSHAELAGLRAEWTRVKSVVAGTGITVDNTDPFNPVVAATGGGGGITDADVSPVTPNDQTGTTYTFVAADRWRLVTCSNASAQTYTVPPNSSVAYPLGAALQIVQKGAGQVTVAPGSGVTLNQAHGLKTSAQWAVVTAVKIATDTWVVTGDTTT